MVEHGVGPTGLETRRQFAATLNRALRVSTVVHYTVV